MWLLTPTYNIGTLKSPLHNISEVMTAIHGREKEEQEAIDLEARLKIMLKITKKQYV